MVGDIAVQVERKAVKNISIRVRRDGTVHASVPRWMSDAEADAFVLSRRTWIEAHAAGSPAASGTLPTTVRVWGEELPLVVEEGAGRRAKAAVRGGRVVVEAGAQAGTEQVIAAVRALLANEVRLALPAVAGRCEARMAVEASAWRIRHMTSRWGSCNVKTHAITINSALAQFPPQCLEEVVTHELCHIYERGHNARFYALMDKYLPEWRSAHALLKTGLIL